MRKILCLRAGASLAALLSASFLIDAATGNAAFAADKVGVAAP